MEMRSSASVCEAKQSVALFFSDSKGVQSEAICVQLPLSTSHFIVTTQEAGEMTAGRY